MQYKVAGEGRMRKISKGFTLIELMVTLVVAAILLGIGVPSLISVYEGNRADSAIRTIHDTLAFARNQAVSYGANVIVCPYAAAPCGSSWSKGISVYILTPANEKKVLRVIDKFHENDILKVTGADSNKQISFTADGFSSAASEFIYCPGGNKIGSRSVASSSTGLIQFGDKDKDC
jgi:type IV fimbrial biogenesis protein FimU